MTSELEIDYKRPWMYPKQREAIFTPMRYSIIEASTKSGKTFGCIAWLFEQALRAPGKGHNFWWVAPILPQAKIAFRRMKRGLPRRLYSENKSELTLTLVHNEATIWFKGSDNPDSLYGEDVYAAVMDEATRCREESFWALRSTLTATQGPIRIIGNVKGRKNWAYKLARRAEAGEPDMHYARIIANDAIEAGILKAGEIMDAKRALPGQVFDELYLAIPTEDGSNPFGIEAIRACIAPLSSMPPGPWGWDLAKSVDWTVGIALDKRGYVCRFERWQASWRETISRIDQHTAGGQALVDSTGVGDPILEVLQDNGLAKYEGFKFGQRSKQQLMEGLAVSIQRAEIHYPEGPITAELEAFEFVYSRSGTLYSAPEGMNDDCVMALALAGHARTHGFQSLELDKVVFGRQRVSSVGAGGY